MANRTGSQTETASSGLTRRVLRRIVPHPVRKIIRDKIIPYVWRGFLIHKVRKREAPVIRSKNELSLLMREGAFLEDEEIALLARYAKQAQNTIVEIGAAFGASSSILILHAGPRVTIHSIDPFVMDSMAPIHATKQRCFRSVSRVLRACKKSPALVRWNFHQCYSYEAVSNWSGQIDLIFIDGDHRYEAVRKDFEDWFPHVSPGGFILLHDSRRLPGQPDHVFNRGWPGPTQLARELDGYPDVRREDEAESLTVWRKLF